MPRWPPGMWLFFLMSAKCVKKWSRDSIFCSAKQMRVKFWWAQLTETERDKKRSLNLINVEFEAKQCDIKESPARKKKAWKHFSQVKENGSQIPAAFSWAWISFPDYERTLCPTTEMISIEASHTTRPFSHSLLWCVAWSKECKGENRRKTFSWLDEEKKILDSMKKKNPKYWSAQFDTETSFHHSHIFHTFTPTNGKSRNVFSLHFFSEQ